MSQQQCNADTVPSTRELAKVSNVPNGIIDAGPYDAHPTTPGLVGVMATVLHLVTIDRVGRCRSWWADAIHDMAGFLSLLYQQGGLNVAMLNEYIHDNWVPDVQHIKHCWIVTARSLVKRKNMRVTEFPREGRFEDNYIYLRFY